MFCKFLPVTKDFRRANMYYMKDGRYFYYPFIFVSPFVSGFDCTRDVFPDAKLIISDSGGYQLKAGTKTKADWDSVLQFQERIANIGLTLDIPPVTVKGNNHEYFDESIFNECMEKSVINAERMIEYKVNEKMKTFAVLQGRNYDFIDTWHRAITRNHDYDGFAIPILHIQKQDHVKQFCEQLEFVKSLDTDFHFLGNCTRLATLVFSRLANISKRQFTFDSSTAANALRYGTYYDPYFFIPISLSKYPSKRVNFKIDGRLPCDCPVCSNHTVRQLAYNPMLSMMHNIYIIQRFNEYSSVITKDDDEFRELLEIIVNLKHKKYFEEIVKGVLKVL